MNNLKLENQIEILIRTQTFILLPQKAVYWKENNALIISDLHLGKSAHFRNNGIPISGETARNDLMKLYQLLLNFKAKKLIIIGDLVHQHYNHEWDDFNALMDKFPDLNIILVKGNHDQALRNKINKIITFEKQFEIDNFIFCHEPLKTFEEGKFYFFGHLHPGVRLKGKAKQFVRLPCYHLKQSFLQLPAFSDFTGLLLIKPEKNDQIFIIAGNEVHAI